MSWDVLLIRVPDGVEAVEQLPVAATAPPLGTRAEVLAVLAGFAPAVDLTNQACGVVRGGSWAVEMSIGAADPVDAIMLHVHGVGGGALPVIGRLAGALGARPLDLSSGEFLATGETGSWRAFQDFRDRLADGWAG